MVACVFALGALAVQPVRAQGVDRLVDALVTLLTPGRSVNMVERSPHREFRFKVKGDVTFTATEDDVESLEGRVTIEEKRGEITRRIDFRPGRGNDAAQVKRNYRVNGREQPLDAEARRWMGEMISSAMRELSIEPQRRVQRLHARGGAVAVLAEIERIHSDHSRRNHIEHFSRLGALDAKTLDRLLAAASPIHSDFELRNALLAVMETQTLAAAQQVAMLKAVAKMQSAYEQRSVLVPLAPKLGSEPDVARSWLAAVQTVHSDFEIRTILESMARRESLTAAQAGMVLDATMKIESDFERATALKAMVRHLVSARGSPLDPFFRSASKIHSDFERGGVLTLLVERVDLDRAGYAPLFAAIDAMQSNHEKQMVLVAVAKKMPRDQELASLFREVASRLSDHERGQVEAALGRVNL